ncbi:MAG TPA: hypothetical protein VIW67_22655, partial [Terriglobales bacterium]
SVFDRVAAHDPIPHVKCKRDEFRHYLERFGIAETTFGAPSSNKPVQVIAETVSGVAAAEVFGTIFFLPIRSLKKDQQELSLAVSLCADAIQQYVRRNRIYLPRWADALQFEAENSLKAEREVVQKRLLEIEQSLQQFCSYKALLTTSGNKLRDIAIAVLRDYFGLNVTERDNNIEDTIINSDSGIPLFIVEIKGVRGGLKREHVNQVDSHRERLGFTTETAGLLVLNDFMEIEGLEERLTRQLEVQHLKHGANLNVRVLRTTTLFKLMREIERLADTERAANFLRVCSKAAGLVQLDAPENMATQAGDSNK